MDIGCKQYKQKLFLLRIQSIKMQRANQDSQAYYGASEHQSSELSQNREAKGLGKLKPIYKPKLQKTMKNMLICDTCGDPFKFKKGLARHMLKSHNTQTRQQRLARTMTYKAVVPPTSYFEKKIELYKQESIEPSSTQKMGGPIKCRHCLKFPNDMVQHLKTNHGKWFTGLPTGAGMRQCYLCEKVLTKKNMPRHLHNAHNKDISGKMLTILEKKSAMQLAKLIPDFLQIEVVAMGGNLQANFDDNSPLIAFDGQNLRQVSQMYSCCIPHVPLILLALYNYAKSNQVGAVTAIQLKQLFAQAARSRFVFSQLMNSPHNTFDDALQVLHGCGILKSSWTYKKSQLRLFQEEQQELKDNVNQHAGLEPQIEFKTKSMQLLKHNALYYPIAKSTRVQYIEEAQYYKGMSSWLYCVRIYDQYHFQMSPGDIKVELSIQNKVNELKIYQNMQEQFACPSDDDDESQIHQQLKKYDINEAPMPTFHPEPLPDMDPQLKKYYINEAPMPTFHPEPLPDIEQSRPSPILLIMPPSSIPQAADN